VNRINSNVMFFSRKGRFFNRVLLLIFTGLFLYTCERLDIVKVVKIETLSVKHISVNTAVGYGNVIDDGGESIIERGICCDTSPNPTFNYHIPSETPKNPFSCILKELKPGTDYHVRAYATNGNDITYGNDIPFTTVPDGVHAVFEKLEAGLAPVIDGSKEDLWNNVSPVMIEKSFQGESPTVTAYWKGMYDDTCIYVLVNVEDNDHYPPWEAIMTEVNWNWDRVELYIDLNDVLEDGQGPEMAYSGHWQAPANINGEDDYNHENYRSMKNTDYEGKIVSQYQSYRLSGENCTYEFRIPRENMTDKNAIPLTAKNLNEKVFGFDITVTDMDKGITSVRQRKVWMNNLSDYPYESWFYMDNAGKIVFR